MLIKTANLLYLSLHTIFMKKHRHVLIVILSILGFYNVQAQEKAVPVFENGEAQIVEAFSNADEWIRHDLWVETTFDTDGDGKMDRMHVDVTRPKQTDTEGLKLPIVYESSPYYAGVAGDADGLFWNVKHELGEVEQPRTHVEVVRTGERPIISNSQIRTWLPRGYIVVHSSSPGTGLSQGSPTVGGINESISTKSGNRLVKWSCKRLYYSRWK